MFYRFIHHFPILHFDKKLPKRTLQRNSQFEWIDQSRIRSIPSSSIFRIYPNTFQLLRSLHKCWYISNSLRRKAYQLLPTFSCPSMIILNGFWGHSVILIDSQSGQQSTVKNEAGLILWVMIQYWECSLRTSSPAKVQFCEDVIAWPVDIRCNF